MRKGSGAGPFTLICKRCNKPFKVRYKYELKRQYCSYECSKDKKQPPFGKRKCEGCRKIVILQHPSSKTRFHSLECYWQHMRRNEQWWRDHPHRFKKEK